MHHSVAFSKLIDYAGLFPPAALAMEPAVAEYVALRTLPQAWMLGRFILPLSSLQAFRTSAGAQRFPVSLILDGLEDEVAFADAIAWVASFGDSINVEALEVPVTSAFSPERLSDLMGRSGIATLPTFCEVRLDGSLRESLERIHAAGFGAKVRCGGMLAAAYPSSEQLARFLVETARVGIAFKATAGLHHPVRGVRDEHNGATMHGFLNVMVGAALARRGAGIETIIPMLESRNASAFAYDGHTLRFSAETIPERELSDVRTQVFTSYGSCSFREPLTDLQNLGMVEPA